MDKNEKAGLASDSLDRDLLKCRGFEAQSNLRSHLPWDGRSNTKIKTKTKIKVKHIKRNEVHQSYTSQAASLFQNSDGKIQLERVWTRERWMGSEKGGGMQHTHETLDYFRHYTLFSQMKANFDTNRIGEGANGPARDPSPNHPFLNNNKKLRFANRGLNSLNPQPKFNSSSMTSHILCPYKCVSGFTIQNQMKNS